MAQGVSLNILDTIHAVFPQYENDKSDQPKTGEVGDTADATLVGRETPGIAVKTAEDMLLNQLKELMRQNDWIQKDENILAPETLREFNHRQTAETMDAIKQLKRRLLYMPDNLTQTVVAELTASGVPLEKISLRVLNAAMQEAADSPLFAAEPSRAEETKRSLRQKIEEIGNLSNDVAAEFIKSGRPLTAENIYIAKYSSANAVEPAVSTLPETLLPEIKKVMAREGIGDTAAHWAAAKLFARHEIPITQVNIDKALFLTNLKTADIPDSVLNSIAQSGGNPFDAVVYGEDAAARPDLPALKTAYDNIVQELSKITKEHINIAFKQIAAGFTGLPNESITLRQLREIVRHPQGTDEQSVSEELPDGSTEQTDKAWEQLQTIRLKLTWEAAVRLADKNVSIDTVSLRAAAEQLDAAERQKCARMLTASDVPASDGNIGKMTALFGQIRGFMPLNPGIAPAIVTARIPFTIAAISAENHRLNECYEQNRTRPSAKYGDSFAKIGDQIAPLLAKLGVDSSQVNTEAAEILIRNGLGVTIGSLSEIKLIHGKINEIYTRLHPSVAADMIKNGFTPSDMPIDEVLSYIDMYSQTYGDNTIETIAKCIRQMEAHKALTQKERDAVLAIYRMLHQARKNGAAALGLGADATLTLGQLLAASKRARQAKHTDEPRAQTNTQAYHEYVVKRFSDRVDAEALIRFIQDNDGFEQLHIETALMKLRESADAYRQAADRLKTLDAPYAAIKFMLENNIPVTLDNMDATKRYLSDKKCFSKTIGQLRALLRKKGTAADIDRFLPNTETLLNADEINGGFMDRLEEIALAIDDPEVIKQIDVVKKSAGISAARRPKAGISNIPVVFNGKVTEIDLFVVNPKLSQMEQADIFISLDAGMLGEIRLLVKTDHNKVSLTIKAAKEESLRRLTENEPLLAELAAVCGYKLTTVQYKTLRQEGGRIYEPV